VFLRHQYTALVSQELYHVVRVQGDQLVHGQGMKRKIYLLKVDRLIAPQVVHEVVEL